MGRRRSLELRRFDPSHGAVFSYAIRLAFLGVLVGAGRFLLQGDGELHGSLLCSASNKKARGGAQIPETGGWAAANSPRKFPTRRVRRRLRLRSARRRLRSAPDQSSDCRRRAS